MKNVVKVHLTCQGHMTTPSPKGYYEKRDDGNSRQLPFSMPVSIGSWPNWINLWNTSDALSQQKLFVMFSSNPILLSAVFLLFTHHVNGATAIHPTTMYILNENIRNEDIAKSDIRQYIEWIYLEYIHILNEYISNVLIYCYLIT
jgi:hypothetical protein